MQHWPHVRDPLVNHVKHLVRGCLTVLLVLLRRESSTCRRRLALGGCDTPAHAIQAQSVPEQLHSTFGVLPSRKITNSHGSFLNARETRSSHLLSVVSHVAFRGARKSTCPAASGSRLDEMAATLHLSPKEGSADGGGLCSTVV